jgi:hypothetical protein
MCDFFSDCLCIGIGADDSDDEIVSKTAVMEPAESRVKLISAWVVPSKLLDAFNCPLDFLKLFFSCLLSLQGVILLPETTNLSAVMFVHLVWSALFSLLKVFLDCFHEVVQFVEVHIR